MDTQHSIIDKLLAENNISALTQNSGDEDQRFFVISDTQAQPFVAASFIDPSNANYDEAVLNIFLQGIATELPKDSVVQISLVHEGYEDYRKLAVQKNEDFNEIEKAELLNTIHQCCNSVYEQESKPLLISVKIPTHADLKPEESKKFVQVVYDKLKNFLMAEIRHLNRDEYVVHHLIY